MARIAGVNIPPTKKAKVGLTYIFGVGDKIAMEICIKSGIDPEKRVNNLSEEELIRLREVIDKDYIVEGDLRRERDMNIKALKDIRCYRGLMHIKKLPVRGQRTSTNARTRKGGKAIAIAGKKMVTK